MEERVIKVFATCTGKDASEITPDIRLDEDLEIKSLDRFALYAMLEGEFGKVADSAVADTWNTVSDFIKFYED